MNNYNVIGSVFGEKCKNEIKDKRYYNLDFVKVIVAILIVFHQYQQLADVQGINFLKVIFILDT